MSDFSFFAKQRFLPLFVTQFLGAANDNLLKTAIMVMISYHGLSMIGLPAEQLVNLSAAIFILPFFLFSASAGKLAEKIDKARLARAVKLAEIAIMLLAGIGFVMLSAPLLLGSLFLMGVHSTFFGPLKYSVLPQYLRSHELVAGNGLIEMGTFVAILLGQIGGSLLVGHGDTGLMITLLGAVALIGWLASRNMPPAPPARPDLRLSFNVWQDSRQLVGTAWQMADVRTAIYGISWFWLMGATFTTQLPTFTRQHLGGDASVYAVLLALFSLGVGFGSVWCARRSHGRLRLGMVLVGALGMTLFGCDLALGSYQHQQGALLDAASFISQSRNWRAMLDVALIGFAGGFFTVPLYTWLQTASPEDFRSQAIAANNIVNGCYMIGAAAASAIILAQLGNIALLFLIASIANLAACWHLMRRAPQIWQTRPAWLGGNEI